MANNQTDNGSLGHTPINFAIGILLKVAARSIGKTEMEFAEKIVTDAIAKAAKSTRGKMVTNANERRLLYLFGLKWGEFRDAAKKGDGKLIKRLIAKSLNRKRVAA